jgi:acetyl-CoA carboxylase biotin carboxylase subunit
MKRVLVANRGEIAVRIIRACQELGLETVAVYSEADLKTKHVQIADTAICIGPPHPRDSYLRGDTIVAVALFTGCDAIHPGYGFLSENPGFAATCEKNGIIFVGPNSDVIHSMGDKIAARTLAAEVGLPVVDGTHGNEITLSDVESLGVRSGYPILIKAAAGGGGRGMRVVEGAAELEEQFEEARSEAQSAFGSSELYAESYLPVVRHIEVQIMGDHSGNVIHFGTRDCTTQRRHQKVIEEAPAIVVPEEGREQICADAVRLASALNYVGAGTVEFIYDVETGKYYFIEMNTRIQVEHPVTEFVTGVDLVREQLRVAEPSCTLSVRQDQLLLRGHAIEMRINAEDVSRGFAPSLGEISSLRIPGGFGVRWESHVSGGDIISPYYDSMVGKLVVHDADREWALNRARRALAELQMNGITTNIEFLRSVLENPDFVSNQIRTTWLEEQPCSASTSEKTQ